MAIEIYIRRAFDCERLVCILEDIKHKKSICISNIYSHQNNSTNIPDMTLALVELVLYIRLYPT